MYSVILTFGESFFLLYSSKSFAKIKFIQFGFSITYNGLGYEYLRDLVLNFASTQQTENPRGFSEVGANQQLLIPIVCAQHGRTRTAKYGSS